MCPNEFNAVCCAGDCKTLHMIVTSSILFTGTVVILLQRSLEYTVLGVGQVVNVDGRQVPDNNIPVYVTSIEPCASGILVTGQVVFWPLN